MMIDAHQHFWWTARRLHTWPEVVGERMSRDFTPEDLKPELQRAGVGGTVLVQSLNDLDETREYLDLAREHDFIRGVVGWIPLVDPAEAARNLESLSQRGKVVGIRHLISFEPDPDWLLQPAVVESLAHLAAKGLAFDAVPMNFRQLETVFRVAARLPDLNIVINHLIRPPIPDRGWEPWASIVTRAAGYPNMAVKLSPGLDLVTRWHWSTSDAAAYARHVIDRFGPGRVMAASNWPVSLLGGSFAEIWSGITDLVGGLSETERRTVLGGTARRIYGLS